MPKITITDCTLRDGSHAMRHQFTKPQIAAYAKGAEAAKIPLITVGHGNGLGASSLLIGRSLTSDHDMLATAKKHLHHTKLGAFVIPGFATIKADIKPAINLGIQVLMVASHCTEANVTAQHIRFAAENKLDTYGVLMMSHMISAKNLLVQAEMMQQYGAKGVLIMDSAGNYLPGDVKSKIGLLSRKLKIKVGFHAHNNLGLSIANSLTAVESGAKFIDCTTRGLGAGAGNCQLEVLVAVLHRLGYKTGLDLYQLMDNSDQIIAPLMPQPPIIDSTRLVSGLAGVFSGFAPLVEKAARRFKVDPRDILVALGKRGAVAGQEDIIVDFAMKLAKS